MTRPRGQSAVMLAALRQRPQSALALNRLGVGRPNSRAAELRRRGHLITCERVPGKAGAASFVYRLLGDTPQVAADEGVTNSGQVSGVSPSEPVRSTVGRSTGSPIADGGWWEPPAVRAVSPAGWKAEPETPVQLSLAEALA